MNLEEMKWRPAKLPGETAMRRALNDALFHVRLERILSRWEGTPYVKGQACQGVGADCVGFVCAVLDEFYCLPRAERPALPADASLHNHDAAVAAMLAIRKRYMPNFSVEDGSLEPGDLLVSSTTPAGGPGHALIVGPRSNEIWESNGRDVHRIGLSLGGKKLFRVYRYQARERALNGRLGAAAPDGRL